MKICLIGSTRFQKGYQQANFDLTKKGHVVYSVTVWSSELTPEQKELFDLVHLRKIMESDKVCLVTDKTGYWGPSTQRELKWAGIILNQAILVYVEDEGPLRPAVLREEEEAPYVDIIDTKLRSLGVLG